MSGPLCSRWFMVWQAGAWRRHWLGANLHSGSLLPSNTILQNQHRKPGHKEGGGEMRKALGGCQDDVNQTTGWSNLIDQCVLS